MDPFEQISVFLETLRRRLKRVALVETLCVGGLLLGASVLLALSLAWILGPGTGRPW